MNNDLLNSSWAISTTEWGRFPFWKKEQLKQDRKIGLKSYYTIIPLPVESELLNLIFRFDFTKPLLLPNTPVDWKLPSPYKFDTHFDIAKIIYTIGKSYPLFKFINKEAKLRYNDFKYKNWTAFNKITIQMQITLVKKESSSNESTTLNNLGEKEITLVLPTISESYSTFIKRDYFKELGTNSASYFQDIYFPLMLEMGFADETKYEVHNKKFDETYNHDWDYLTVAVTYTKNNQ